MEPLGLFCFRNFHRSRAFLVEGEGFEPSKPVATDLQSVPFDRSGTPPKHVLSNNAPGRECEPNAWLPFQKLPSYLSCLACLGSWRWESNPQPADYKSAALPLSYS